MNAVVELGEFRAPLFEGGLRLSSEGVVDLSWASIVVLKAAFEAIVRLPVASIEGQGISVKAPPPQMGQIVQTIRSGILFPRAPELVLSHVNASDVLIVHINEALALDIFLDEVLRDGRTGSPAASQAWGVRHRTPTNDTVIEPSHPGIILDPGEGEFLNQRRV